MKKKLQLDELKVMSFVTLGNNQSEEIKGGMKDPSIKQCTDMTCGIVRCTYTMDLACYLTMDC
jgi:hypothetical protein